MAKIQTLDAPSLDVGPRQVVEGSPELAGASNARRFEAALKVANYADSLQEIRLKARDNDFFNTTVAQTEIEFNNAYTKMQQERLNNPQGAAEDFNKYLNETIAKRGEGARTLSERSRLDSALTNQMVRYGTDAVSWENNRTVAIYQDNLDAAIDAKMELAARSGDKATLDRLYGEVTSMVHGATASAENPGGFLPQENARVRLDKAKNIYATGMEAMIYTNPSRAMQELQSGAWDKELNPIRKAKAIEMVQRRFSANAERDRRVIEESVDDLTAYVNRTGDLDGALSGAAKPNFSLQAVEANYGTQLGEKVMEKLRDAKMNYEIRREVFTTPPAQLDQKISAVTESLDVFSSDYAERDGYLRKLQKMRSDVYGSGTEVQGAITQDPAGFVFQAAKYNHAPLQPTDFRAIVAEQRKYGLKDSQIGILGMQRAMQIADQINGAATTEEKIGHINGLREQLRMPDSEDDENNKFMQYAMNDLHKAGIDPQLAIVSMMNDPQDVAAQRMGITVLEQGRESLYKELKVVMDKNDNGDSEAKLNAEVERALEDMTNSYKYLPGNNPANLRPVREMAQMVAAGFYVKGNSMEQAAQRATNYINNRYNFSQQSGVARGFNRGVGFMFDSDATVRMPKKINGTDINPDDVMAYARDQLGELLYKNPDALVLPPTYTDRELYRDEVMRDAQFVTSNDDKTINLVMTDGAAVEIEMGGQRQRVSADILTAQEWMNKNGGNRMSVVTMNEMNTNFANGNLAGLKKMRENITNSFAREGATDLRLYLPELDERIRLLENKREAEGWQAPMD